MPKKKEPSRNERRWKRYPVSNGAVVMLSKPSLMKLGRPVSIKLGPIKDISMKGLAVQYVDGRKLLKNVKSLSIMVPGEGVLVEKISFKSVADFEVARLPNDKTIRTLCVSFDKLTPMQKIQLERFIDSCIAADKS